MTKVVENVPHNRRVEMLPYEVKEVAIVFSFHPGRTIRLVASSCKLMISEVCDRSYLLIFSS